jgi:drug/metabolite transporter (DMT)-like permease
LYYCAISGLFEASSNGQPSQSNAADDHGTTQYSTTVHIRHRKILYGVALAIGGAVCFAGSTFCIRRSLRSIRSFYAPFFVSYFMTSWTILFYPAYIVVRSAAAKGRLSLRDIFRQFIQHYIYYTFAAFAENKFTV